MNSKFCRIITPITFFLFTTFWLRIFQNLVCKSEIIPEYQKKKN